MIIKSKKYPKMTCHVIDIGKWVNKERIDYSDEKEFMQVAKHSRPVGRDAPPHQHIRNVRTIDITQEAWVIVQGKIKAKLYDIDGTLLYETIMEAGNCLITFYGGHGFEVLEDVTMFEFKNGPYLGVEKDKVFYV